MTTNKSRTLTASKIITFARLDVFCGRFGMGMATFISRQC